MSPQNIAHPAMARMPLGILLQGQKAAKGAVAAMNPQARWGKLNLINAMSAQRLAFAGKKAKASWRVIRASAKAATASLYRSGTLRPASRNMNQSSIMIGITPNANASPFNQLGIGTMAASMRLISRRKDGPQQAMARSSNSRWLRSFRYSANR